MIGYILQIDPPEGEVRLYQPPPVPRTVIVLKKDFEKLLRTVDLSKVIEQSQNGLLVGHSPPLREDPTYFWGIAERPQDFKATPYPHYLNPKDTQASLVRATEGVSGKDIKTWGLEVPPAVVLHYGLRRGYEVEVEVLGNYRRISGNNLVVISRVNGCDDPAVIRRWSTPAGVSLPRTSYPREIIPLDKFGSLSWRMLNLLGAVQGYGQVTYLSGEGGLGKTTIALDAWEAVLRLTLENPKIFALLIFIGERGEDLDDYLELIKKTPHDSNRVEVIAAPKGTGAKFQWQVFEYAYYRSFVLGMLYHVVTFYESASRAVDAYRAVADPSGGMVTGGIPTEAITRVAAMVGLGGYYPELDTSNTNIVITLDGNKAADPLVQFTLMTREHNPTSRVQLVASTQIGFPKISVISLETGTRRRERFTPQALIDEQAFVMGIASKSLSGDGSTVKPEVTYARLKSYAEQNPVPAYISGAGFKIEQCQSQWEQIVRLSEQLKRPIDDVVVEAQGLFLRLLMQQNGFGGKVAVLTDKNEPVEFIKLPKGPGEKLTFVKSSDPQFAQILGGDNGRR